MNTNNISNDRIHIKENIVFFDGICVLCNASIDFLIKIDKRNSLKYASLQGKTAQKLLSHYGIKNMESIVFISNQILHKKSDAVLQILGEIGGFWKVFLVLKIIPRKLRDRIYDIIAKKRYSWFGKKKTCRMPTQKDQGKILP